MATINGTTGNDFLKTAAGGDRLRGLAGDDVLSSAFSHTMLEGGLGSDYLSLAVPGQAGQSQASGTLDGGAGADTLVATAQSVSDFSGPITASNRLFGRDGFDTLTASASATINQFDADNPEAQVATASNLCLAGRIATF